MASCSKLPVGPGTATARPAASLCPAPSSSSPSSVHRRGRVRPRAIERAPHPRCCCCLCTRADSPRFFLHFACSFGSTQGRPKGRKIKSGPQTKFHNCRRKACVREVERAIMSAHISACAADSARMLRLFASVCLSVCIHVCAMCFQNCSGSARVSTRLCTRYGMRPRRAGATARARMPILEGKWALLAVCILLAAEGRAGAAGNGHSRVRHFCGLVRFPRSEAGGA